MIVVIIGAGIAGLTLANYLDKDGINVVLNERGGRASGGGHAFLMHANGLGVLKELTNNSMDAMLGNRISRYTLRRPDDTDVQSLYLDDWYCVKRTELIQFLGQSLTPGIMRDHRQFTHFIYDNNKIVAAAFANGEVEHGDIFVGADGGFSQVRESILGRTNFHHGRVKEIVGVASNPELAAIQRETFTKFQSATAGLSFGIIPTSKDELVWFMQYDPLLADIADQSPEALAEFCYRSMQSFPAVVGEVLQSNDFEKTYVWNTRDFDVLPTFSHDNVVLIGDAAHLALPFTSAGTTNALVDAQVLSQMLKEEKDSHIAFERYYAIRSKEVADHLKLGRALRNSFLEPGSHVGEHPRVPLISEAARLTEISSKRKVDVLYFTDPICSTCWVIQPILRKLKLEYGGYMNIQYIMGGLLPSWEEYSVSSIKKPADAAEPWELACACREMPLDGDVWIEDPLHSSYPPSIAFKAAQLQDPEKAMLF